MKTTFTETDGRLVIAVEGELDTDTCAQFQKDIAPFMDRKNLNVELDFAKLEYISSKALRVLISFQQAVFLNGGTLKITNVNDTVHEIFNLTGLSSSFLTE